MASAKEHELCHKSSRPTVQPAGRQQVKAVWPMPMLSSVNVCEKKESVEQQTMCVCVCVCGSVTERASGRVRGGLQLIAYIHIHICATLCTVNAAAAAALLLRRRRLSAATAADYMASLLYGGVCIGIGNRAECLTWHTHTHTKGRHKHCLIIVEHTLCI